MRVIAGEYRGRRLKTVPDLSVRPATDRVKQAIFDTLASRIDLDGVHVLDLFAGSGSLGIEALSRGAADVVFVESNPAAARAIRDNMAELGCPERGDVIPGNAMRFLRSGTGPYDVVFADPPYAFDQTPSIPALAFETGIVGPGGWLLIEHLRGLEFESSKAYRVGPVKVFGRSVVSFFTHPSATS